MITNRESMVPEEHGRSLLFLDVRAVSRQMEHEVKDAPPWTKGFRESHPQKLIRTNSNHNKLEPHATLLRLAETCDRIRGRRRFLRTAFSSVSTKRRSKLVWSVVWTRDIIRIKSIHLRLLVKTTQEHRVNKSQLLCWDVFWNQIRTQVNSYDFFWGLLDTCYYKILEASPPNK